MVDLAQPSAGDGVVTDAPTLPVPVLLLIVAFAAGLVAQGGYYPVGRVLVTGLVAVAVTVAVAVAVLVASPHRPLWPVGGRAVAVVAGALAVWAVVRTVPAGGVAEPVAEAASLGCVVGVLVVLGRSGPPVREFVAQILVWVGVVVAGTAWLGVAWRVPRFAILVENKLWRGASTLTYPNAAAAVLVPLALLAIALAVTRPAARSWPAAGFLLLVGVGATLSRAGFVALAAGLVVLAVLAGVPRTVSRALPPLLGAAVAVAALVASFPDATPPQPARAVLGLVAGAVVAVGPALLPGRLRAGAVVLLLGVTVAGGAWFGRDQFGPVWSIRGNLDSSGRSGALRAAFEMVGQQPWTGTGVGRARFLWPTPDGTGAVALYVHNEYVQTLVDLGAIGAALLLALIVAIGGYLYRGRRRPTAGSGGETDGHRPGIREGAVAGVAAFAVHSAFDFLWHIPVLLLTAGVLIGLAGPVPHNDTVVHTQRGRT